MGVWIMAGVTFREAARKKFLWIGLGAGFGFLALFGIGLHYQLATLNTHVANPILRREIVGAVLTMGLYAIDLLMVAMTVLTSVDTLSGEIASGTIQAVATKPVTRWQVLAGKWLGFAAMLTIFIAVLVGGINLLSYAMARITAYHVARGFALMWLECLLLLALTFCFGTSFSTLTTGVLTLGLHGLAFIGGWIEQIGALTGSPKAVNVGIVASVLMPSESLWRRAAFEMQSPVAAAFQITPFSNASIPSAAMVTYAAIYMLIALGFALRLFQARDL